MHVLIASLGPANRQRLAAAVLGLAFLAQSSPAAIAGAVWLPGFGGSDNVAVKSIAERKFEQVVRQRYDFSCGSAALATLLTYHYEKAVDEQTAFNYMYQQGNQEKIKSSGFSLLDIKGYLEGHGYQADGFQASLDTLADTGVPAITLLNVNGYQHFVVVKGVTDQEVLVGDPSLGLKFFNRDQFETMWKNGILFIITNEPETGKKHFNSAKTWEALARAPSQSALIRSDLADPTASMPRIGEF